MEISVSGSGEGLGWVTGRGYSTRGFLKPPISSDMSNDAGRGETVPIRGRFQGPSQWPDPGAGSRGSREANRA